MSPSGRKWSRYEALSCLLRPKVSISWSFNSWYLLSAGGLLMSHQLLFYEDENVPRFAQTKALAGKSRRLVV